MTAAEILQNNKSSTEAGVDLASSSLRYDYQVERLDETDHYGRLLSRIGKSKRVLELGSSTGYLSQAMQERGCSVVGVEIDPDAAEVARAKGFEVHVLDLDFIDLSKHFAGRLFDAVLLADVLEHLRSPEKTLKQLSSLLAPEGLIVASIPHGTHGDIRMATLMGRLPFRPMGLLDHTHVRFFTRALVEKLFVESGYDIVQLERNRWNTGYTEVSFEAPRSLPPDLAGLKNLLDCDPESDTYQFIVQARLSAPRAENLPAVEVAVIDTPLQRADDIYHQALKLMKYDQNKLRFWFCSGTAAEDKIEIADRPAKESPKFAESDFRSFRFLDKNGQDTVPEHASQCRLQVAGGETADKTNNIGKILKRIALGSSAPYIFVLTTDTLPAANCLHQLVTEAEFLNCGAQRILLTARAEVSRESADEADESEKACLTGGKRDSEGYLPWHEFAGMLIPRELLLSTTFSALTGQAEGGHGDSGHSANNGTAMISDLGASSCSPPQKAIKKEGKESLTELRKREYGLATEGDSLLDSSFMTNLAQAQDFCFRLWQSGARVKEGAGTYFSNGPRLAQGSPEERLFDGLRLRRRWGTNRQFLSFSRHIVRRAWQEGGFWQGLKLLNHTLAVILLEQPSALPQTSPAKNLVGFHGPFARHTGA